MREIDKLTYNVDVLREQARAVDSIKDDLSNSADKLKAQLEQLQGEWVSGAADAFFDGIDANWTAKIEAYCRMLDDVSNALSSAANDYDAIEQAYNHLNLEL